MHAVDGAHHTCMASYPSWLAHASRCCSQNCILLSQRGNPPPAPRPGPQLLREIERFFLLIHPFSQHKSLGLTAPSPFCELEEKNMYPFNEMSNWQSILKYHDSISLHQGGGWKSKIFASTLAENNIQQTKKKSTIFLIWTEATNVCAAWTNVYVVLIEVVPFHRGSSQNPSRVVQPDWVHKCNIKI